MTNEQKHEAATRSVQANTRSKPNGSKANGAQAVESGKSGKLIPVQWLDYWFKKRINHERLAQAKTMA